VLCQRTRPSKGVRLGPNAEDFSYFTVLPQRKAQYSDFLLLQCVATEQGPIQGPSIILYSQRTRASKGVRLRSQITAYYGGLLLLCSVATGKGPVQGPIVIVLCRQRTRPRKGVRLGPNTEDFSYCTMSPLIRAQYRVFYYCTVLPRDEGPVQGLSVTVVCYQRNGPTKAAF